MHPVTYFLLLWYLCIFIGIWIFNLKKSKGFGYVILIVIGAFSLFIHVSIKQSIPQYYAKWRVKYQTCEYVFQWVLHVFSTTMVLPYSCSWMQCAGHTPRLLACSKRWQPLLHQQKGKLLLQGAGLGVTEGTAICTGNPSEQRARLENHCCCSCLPAQSQYVF